MLNSFSLAEQLLYSTVKLTSSFQGNITGTGTGFFSTFNRTNNSISPVIITNNHVVQGSDKIHLKCHIRDNNSNVPSGRFLDINISLHDSVVQHPDLNIDLCAISFGAILNQAVANGTPIFNSTIEMDLIPDLSEWQYFDAIEEVTMIGCPNGLSDDTNNLPLVRKGITASNPSKPYNGKQEFVIDMACFPGSSGSPIFLYNPNGYFDRQSNLFRMGEQRLRLLGILYAGPQVTNSGNIILANPPQFNVKSMMHLGFAIRSSEVRILEQHFISTIC